MSDLSELKISIHTIKQIKKGINTFPIENGGIDYDLIIEFLDESIKALRAELPSKNGSK